MNDRGARQRTFWWLSVVLGAAVAGCGSLTSVEVNDQCPPEGCFPDASVDDAKGGSPDVVTPEPDSGPLPNPSCGLGCDPDQDKACINQELEAGADAGAGHDAASVPDDAELDASDEADSPGGNMGAFGPSSSPNAEDAGKPAAFACQVTWEGQSPKAECTASGAGKMNDACSRSSDCAAGLTCVGTLSIGRCLKYCCVGNDACPSASKDSPAGFYCSDEISRDYLIDHPTADPAELRKVPVCVAGRGCDPIDPDKDPSRCDTGLSCAIVRSDGTTGCVALPAEAAKEGGSCKDVPCAEGHVCAKTTNVCMKLCHTAKSDECVGGVCQGSTNVPAGFGICVRSYDK
jgi:hypothetical protein